MNDANVYLFQYGSNMSTKRLNSANRLNGRARPIGKARLDGWGVRFDLYSASNQCAVTDIVRSNDEHVWGVLFLVPRELVIAPRGSRSLMDMIEGGDQGALSNYQRETIYVRRGRHLCQAETYLGTRQGRARFRKLPPKERRVSKEYLSHLITGAAAHNLSKSYVRHIRAEAGELK